mmetsp:Transcript_21427/g.35466  ORF Transcript_21427/g.35466 Transcript_21427/m.35466 type:complete len:135 (-) Transcript_21427:206-610(-)|eukprot:CAMPEP_0119015308 /NCGR_PEP_ID=MMETSP1176-20130426/10786_1 /TAXON_ID=265551 /ORGANISM="Synedropsis recta cf, Strain CCMP1620" /LENGTH=134 /DNA_ID=CAMNT_0006968587 /DNA_START=74 /DNA_END=478 /DNA_ORIENTATION=+
MRVTIFASVLVSVGAFTVVPSNRPSVSLNAIDLDTTQLAAGAAAIALVGAGAAFAIGGKGAAPEVVAEPEPEPEPIDISIPYDAAILLAYDAWRVEGDRGDFDQSSYEKYKPAYISKAIAEVTLKKATREMALL